MTNAHSLTGSIGNFASLFSENARRMRLTGYENQSVTLTSRRRQERNLSVQAAFRMIAPPRAPWHCRASSIAGKARNDAEPEDAQEGRRRISAALRRARAAPRGADRAARRARRTARPQIPRTAARARCSTSDFRKASLVQRAAILEAADWLITMLDRSITADVRAAPQRASRSDAMPPIRPIAVPAARLRAGYRSASILAINQVKSIRYICRLDISSKTTGAKTGTAHLRG